MRPADYALDLYRGDTYSWVFKLWTDYAFTTPVDLTGVTAKAEIRERPGGTRVCEMVCTITTPNEIHVKLPADAWTPVDFANGAWDLQLTYPQGDVCTILAGAVKVTGDVTDSTAINRAVRL